MNGNRYLVEMSYRDRAAPFRQEEAPSRRQFSLKTVTSRSLFEGDSEIGIEHGGALYRLKITRQGKLILNK